ncbi:MAG TPA: iron-sulfur cluster repair di-iron protein [Polyangiaceae bacterium]|nr:iron-sulfur cluster repair di-iron protein [Polyangiaceae bacterium]
MAQPITAATSLAEIATGHAAASRVFQRRRLDFCCHGSRSLSQACEDRGLDPESVIEEILGEEGAASKSADFHEQPLDEIVAHIVEHYHQRLRAELPALVTMAKRVEARHGDKPSCPHGLARHLEKMQHELFRHLDKEERALFPTIVLGQGRLAATPIRVMESEHEEHAAAVAETRKRTDDYTPPPEACPTWRALYLRLEEFELELMEHVHLENHVLFPRALRT